MGDRLKVAVGLSGGVDSSVAAALLKNEGHEVTGITMEIYDGTVGISESVRHACFGPGEKEDLASAESICKKLDMPFLTIDLKEEYRTHVIDYFREEYLSGRTPNPCIVCNRRLKFGFLLEKARQAGVEFDFFATGHYARIDQSEGRSLLKRALDRSKDQTYFIYTLRSDQLSKTLFPLGAYTKTQVREMARSSGLETANRPESQDFIAGGDYSPLFAGNEIEEGDIVDQEGHVLGRHRGIIHYTIGQRRGLGISSPHPLYVTKIDPGENRLVVSDKENLTSRALIANDINLIAMDRLDRPYQIGAKIRLKHKEAEATLLPYEGDKAKVVFNEPQASITPGQSVVFYSDDIVLGGGIIEKAL